MSLKTVYSPCRGGINRSAPPLETAPGELIDCLNYECLVNGGYRRILGYTLFDGKAVPDSAVPGSGAVLGVHLYRGDAYAIREDGSNARLYKATASGWAEVDNTFTWSTGGNYHFTNYNFYGQDSQEAMFIANGVDKAAMFDGSSLSWITTNATPDTPKAVAGHKFHLFLAVESSLINSATGDPTDYQAINGAAEIAVGDTINDLSVTKGALLIACEDRAQVLYGSDSSDWQLEQISRSGSYAHTLADIGGDLVGLDRLGVMSLSASQAYGNFAYSALSQKVEPYIPGMITSGNLRAVTHRGNNQYRLFAGASGLWFTFSGTQLVGATRIQLEHPVTALSNGYDANRAELTLFGSDDGKVYQLDSGYSFDGAAVDAFVALSFHSYGGPTQRKRFRLLQPDFRVTGAAHPLYVRASTEYGGGFTSGQTISDLQLTGGGFWDFSFWDELVYDAQFHQDARARLNVSGTNMAVIISSNTASGAHALYGITVHYSPRRLKR